MAASDASASARGVCGPTRLSKLPDGRVSHTTIPGLLAMSKTPLSSPDAPKAIGPYSQAVRAGQLLFASGQIPLDPASGSIVEGDVTAQTRRVMENLRAVLKAGGLSLADVVRTTIYLIDLN